MAKENTNLDQFFKEKLSQDSIKPSKLAWERLESQLPQEKKTKTPLIWWSIAASLAAIFVVGYFAFTFSTNSIEEPILATAEENQIEEQLEEPKSIQNQSLEEIPTQTEENPILPTEKKIQSTNPTIQKSSAKAKSSSSNLIAVTEAKPALENSEKKMEANPILEELKVPALELPSIQATQTVASATEAKVEEEPAYRVKIYSNGLEEDKTLITGISKKVEKVEGLLGKVDQGFADLQDAKSNLFTALLSKKEKAADQP